MPLVDIAIIADDLTGALDAAAPFAARGADTRVAATADLDRLGTPMPAVLSVSTTSRHLGAAAAARTVGTACANLARLEPALWFKKVDSTLRGNVAVEIDAALAASGLEHAVVCPAVPAHGRTVEGGIVMVDGVPLADTDFVRDAVSPASPEPLAAQLRALNPACLVEECVSLAADETNPRGVWVADAKNANDLSAIAAWLVKQNGQSLAVGAAGLGEAIAEARLGPRRIAATNAIAGPILYVIGSRAARTDAQVARLLLDDPDCRQIDAPGGSFDATEVAATLNGRNAVIRVPRRGDDPPAETVAQLLGRAVATLLQKSEFGTVFLTGGDTAAAVLAAIDHPVVALDGEVVPGVPHGHVEFAGRQLRLITKAGGFGDETLLVDIAGWVET